MNDFSIRTCMLLCTKLVCVCARHIYIYAKCTNKRYKSHQMVCVCADGSCCWNRVVSKQNSNADVYCHSNWFFYCCKRQIYAISCLTASFFEENFQIIIDHKITNKFINWINRLVQWHLPKSRSLLRLPYFKVSVYTVFFCFLSYCVLNYVLLYYSLLHSKGSISFVTVSCCCCWCCFFSHWNYIYMDIFFFCISGCSLGVCLFDFISFQIRNNVWACSEHEADFFICNFFCLLHF